MAPILSWDHAYSPWGLLYPFMRRHVCLKKNTKNFLLLSFCLTFPYSSPLEYSLYSLCRILPEYILMINPVLEK